MCLYCLSHAPRQSPLIDELQISYWLAFLTYWGNDSGIRWHIRNIISSNLNKLGGEGEWWGGRAKARASVLERWGGMREEIASESGGEV